jgi:hypothetical protein
MKASDWIIFEFAASLVAKTHYVLEWRTQPRAG